MYIYFYLTAGYTVYSVYYRVNNKQTNTNGTYLSVARASIHTPSLHIHNTLHTFYALHDTLGSPNMIKKIMKN